MALDIDETTARNWGFAIIGAVVVAAVSEVSPRVGGWLLFVVALSMLIAWSQRGSGSTGSF